MGKPGLYRGFRLRRRPAVHPSRPPPACQTAQQRRQMHADLLHHPDAGLHLPLLRVGAGPGPGHGAVAMPVRGRCRLPPPGLGLPPLAKPFPVRPPGMALAHRHHVPHAAFSEKNIRFYRKKHDVNANIILMYHFFHLLRCFSFIVPVLPYSVLPNFSSRLTRTPYSLTAIFR